MGYGRYLRRRGYTYYFRCRWPKRFAAFHISGEHLVSLGTRDYTLALHRARLLKLGMETLMTRFTPTTSKADAEAIVRRWIDSALWRQEAHLAETDGIAYFDPEEIEKLGREEAAELDALLQYGDRRHAGDQKAAIARALGPIGPGLEAYGELIDGVGRQIDVPVNRATPDGRLNARMILHGFATYLNEARETLAAIPRLIQGASDKLELPKFPFLSFWAEFRATKLSDAAWKKDTAGNADATPKLFRDLIGDIPTNEVDGGVAGKFRREFLKLPWNYHSDKVWKKLSPTAVIAALAKLKLEDREKIRLTTPKSANKHGGVLIEYWDQLVRDGKIPPGIDNPFRGHQTARNQGRAARGEHPMWPVDMDIALFNWSHTPS
jgi:uncharacterized protein DUF6538